MKEEKKEKEKQKVENLYILAWSIVMAFFGLCIFLMFVALPAGSSNVVYMLFGALASGFSTVVNYFFGSSKSSSEKTKLLIGKENSE